MERSGEIGGCGSGRPGHPFNQFNPFKGENKWECCFAKDWQSYSEH